MEYKYLKIGAILLFAVLLFGCISPSDNGATPSNGNQANNNTSVNSGNSAKPSSDNQVEEKGFWSYFNSNVKYKADYTITTTGTAGANKEINSKITQYVSGKNSRIDMSIQGTKSRTYLLDNKLYMCGQTEETWKCVSIKSQQTNNKDKLNANQAAYTPTQIPSMIILGEATNCYKLDDVDESIIEYCFNGNGVVLWSKMSGEGTVVEMTATSYSTEVTDVDFVLPEEVTEMPSYGQ